MELINKSHPDIIKQSAGALTVNIGNKAMYFSKIASIEGRMDAGRYVHFINDGRKWSYIVNDENDGFMLYEKTTATGKRGVTMQNPTVLRLFKNRMGITNVVTYYVQETKEEFKGCKVWEILTYKTIEELKKEK